MKIVTMKATCSICSLVAALCATSLAEGTNELGKAESSEELPSIKASVSYHSMKIERGMVEIDQSVFGYELALEWYGLFGGIETCYDMTGVNHRRGRYNEIESFLGYGHKFGDLTAKAAYTYKKCILEEPDTQEVELELEYETPWVVPFFEFACDTHSKAGAFYGATGLARKCELTDWLTLAMNGGIGFGNPHRNDADYGQDKWAFREMHLGAALEIELCPHVKLVPAIDFYDYFTESQRRFYDKFNGFAAVGSCSLMLDF